MQLISPKDARLNQASSDYLPSDDASLDIKELYTKMLEIMNKNGGIGLAAPQLGIMKRIFIAGTELFINPKITKLGYFRKEEYEACLSFPNFSQKVLRNDHVLVHYLDINLEQQEKYFKDYMARVIQHEYDHLNGITLPSYSSNFKKSSYFKNLP